MYICESVFDEIKGQIKRFTKPGELKKIVNDAGVTKDEIYFFKKPITPQKVFLGVFYFVIFGLKCINNFPTLQIPYSEYNNLETSRHHFNNIVGDEVSF